MKERLKVKLTDLCVPSSQRFHSSFSRMAPFQKWEMKHNRQIFEKGPFIRAKDFGFPNSKLGERAQSVVAAVFEWGTVCDLACVCKKNVEQFGNCKHLFIAIIV